MSSIGENDVNIKTENNKEYEQPDDTSGITPTPLDNMNTNEASNEGINNEDISNVESSPVNTNEETIEDVSNVESNPINTNEESGENESNEESGENESNVESTPIDNVNIDENVVSETINEPVDNTVGSELLKNLWENWWMIYMQLQKLSKDDVDLINKKKECIQAQLAFQSQYNTEKSPKSLEGGNKLSSLTSMVMNPSKLFTKKIGGIKKRKTKKRRIV